MPSAHSWNVSVPQGPMSLCCTVALSHVKGPSAMCKHDQLRGSNERTYSMSWPELPPPISILAPPFVGEAPARVPFILPSKRIVLACCTTQYAEIETYLDISQLHTATVLAGPVYSGSMPTTIRHRSSDHEGRTFVTRGIAYCANFLVRSKECNRCLNEVLCARA